MKVIPTKIVIKDYEVQKPKISNGMPIKLKNSGYSGILLTNVAVAHAIAAGMLMSKYNNIYDPKNKFFCWLPQFQIMKAYKTLGTLQKAWTLVSSYDVDLGLKLVEKQKVEGVK